MKQWLARLFKRPVNKRALLTRLSLGGAVVLFTVLLILWDAGILVIPGLQAPGRRRFEPKHKETPDEETTAVDWAAWSEDQILALYDVSRLDAPLSLLTGAAFDGNAHSVARQFFSEADRLSVFAGMILAEKDGQTRYYLPGTVDLGEIAKQTGQEADMENAYPVLSAASLTQLPIPDGMSLTRRLTAAGQPVFEDAGGSLYALQTATGTLLPYEPSLMWEGSDWETVPGDEGDGSGLVLIRENGLYGYTGSNTVPCVYPVAFPYSEGVAVMADADGNVTLRNAAGEELLPGVKLLLPELWREDDSLCLFRSGLLRVVFARFNERGELVNRNDGIMFADGRSFPLPDGYRATAFSEGIFTVTNGENYGYYAASGTWVGTPEYTFASPFREGLASVTGEEGRQGLLSRQGKVLLAPSFDEIGAFSGGLAVVREASLGQVLLWKVEGLYPPPGETEDVPERAYYERVPLQRGPKNTFDNGDDIVIVFPEMDHVPWETPGQSKTPVYTVPVITDRQDPPPSSSSTVETPPASDDAPVSPVPDPST